ncbi:hypothetical protein evm_013324 [Chilo suppressalis]|nr:hypothetical protein evm_013324 [Chilo suppressalis]
MKKSKLGPAKVELVVPAMLHVWTTPHLTSGMESFVGTLSKKKNIILTNELQTNEHLANLPFTAHAPGKKEIQNRKIGHAYLFITKHADAHVGNFSRCGQVTSVQKVIIPPTHTVAIPDGNETVTPFKNIEKPDIEKGLFRPCGDCHRGQIGIKIQKVISPTSVSLYIALSIVEKDERGDRIKKFRNENKPNTPHSDRHSGAALKAVHRLTSFQFGRLRHGVCVRAAGQGHEATAIAFREHKAETFSTHSWNWGESIIDLLVNLASGRINQKNHFGTSAWTSFRQRLFAEDDSLSYSNAVKLATSLRGGRADAARAVHALAHGNMSAAAPGAALCRETGRASATAGGGRQGTRSAGGEAQASEHRMERGTLMAQNRKRCYGCGASDHNYAFVPISETTCVEMQACWGTYEGLSGRGGDRYHPAQAAIVTSEARTQRYDDETHIDAHNAMATRNGFASLYVFESDYSRRRRATLAGWREEQVPGVPPARGPLPFAPADRVDAELDAMLRRRHHSSPSTASDWGSPLVVPELRLVGGIDEAGGANVPRAVRCALRRRRAPAPPPRMWALGPVGPMDQLPPGLPMRRAIAGKTYVVVVDATSKRARSSLMPQRITAADYSDERIAEVGSMLSRLQQFLAFVEQLRLTEREHAHLRALCLFSPDNTHRRLVLKYSFYYNNY